jgi:hypothetical protein
VRLAEPRRASTSVASHSGRGNVDPTPSPERELGLHQFDEGRLAQRRRKRRPYPSPGTRVRTASIRRGSPRTPDAETSATPSPERELGVHQFDEGRLAQRRRKRRPNPFPRNAGEDYINSTRVASHSRAERSARPPSPERELGLHQFDDVRLAQRRRGGNVDQPLLRNARCECISGSGRPEGRPGICDECSSLTCRYLPLRLLLPVC